MDTLHTDFTRTLYIHPDVEVVFQNDRYSVKARKDLGIGTLILLEHVISGTLEEVVASIMVDEPLFTQLYPRDNRNNPSTNKNMSYRNNLAETKMNMNTFKFDDDVVLGNTCSKFNHSCQPNCHMALADKPHIKGCIGTIPIYGMWVTRKITQGQELTIDYTSGHIHIHDAYKQQYGWQCACTPGSLIAQQPQIQKRANIQMELCAKLANMQQGFIRPTVDAHITKPSTREVILRHVLGKRGIFLSQSGVVVASVAAAQLDVDREVEKYKRLVNKGIMTWTNTNP